MSQQALLHGDINPLAGRCFLTANGMEREIPVINIDGAVYNSDVYD